MKKIISGGTGEFTDKKSRFIANIYHIEDEDMAVKIIEQLRKKYWDARHNCYAYVLGGKSEIQRFSDDGEPSGTAGKPILEVITGNECGNCLCVVTRYFGGVLLGTGGLIMLPRKHCPSADLVSLQRVCMHSLMLIIIMWEKCSTYVHRMI